MFELVLLFYHEYSYIGWRCPEDVHFRNKQEESEYINAHRADQNYCSSPASVWFAVVLLSSTEAKGLCIDLSLCFSTIKSQRSKNDTSLHPIEVHFVPGLPVMSALAKVKNMETDPWWPAFCRRNWSNCAPVRFSVRTPASQNSS